MLLALVGSTVFITNPIFGWESVPKSDPPTYESLPFKVIATLPKQLVHVGDAFEVALVVKNVTNTNQHFQVWICGNGELENWRTDNPAIGGVEHVFCLLPTQVNVELTPGDSYKIQLPLSTLDSALGDYTLVGTAKFRLGFFPNHEMKQPFAPKQIKSIGATK